MKKSNFSVALQNLPSKLIKELAIKSGLQKREPRKITPQVLLEAYCQESVGNSLSLNDIAGIVYDATGVAPSRQGVGKRINDSFVVFIQMVLEHVMGQNIKSELQYDSCFQRIIVQDSTVLQLPHQLFDEFSGVSNGKTRTCNARIQAVYELINKEFLSFSIDKYSKNDLEAAPELSVRAGDLTLRDRGYLKHDEIERLNDSGAHFIYRHKASTNYRDTETGEMIDLEKLLKKNGSIDMEVHLNNKERTSVRLVAVPVDEETANLRRMKEKKKQKRHTPSKKLLSMMSWTIFITNLPKEKFEFKQILHLYGLRWRIETIFKTWKSNMSFNVIHRVSSTQLKALLLARLITIVITMNYVYKKGSELVGSTTGKFLSLTKLMRFIQVRRERLCNLIVSISENPQEAIMTLTRFCTYDKRTYLNYAQNEAIAMNLLKLS